MPTRLIREGLLDSERVCGLTVDARWLFVTICLQADDVGLFDAAPFALMRKAELQRDLGPHLLGVLVDVDLIRLYDSAEFPGKRFGFVPRYGQRLRITRLKHPLPPLALVADDPEASRKIKYLASKMSADGGSLRPEAEVEAEQEKRSKEKEIPSPSRPLVRTPHEKVLKLWSELRPECPQPSIWTPARKRYLSARWKDLSVAEGWRSEEDGLRYFARLFRYCGKSPFLMGKTRAREGKPPFELDLPWLIRPENMLKVIEGFYHRETA